MASDTFRLDIRLPRGTRNELDRIGNSTGHNDTDIVKIAVHALLLDMIERGEIASKCDDQESDEVVRLLKKLFGGGKGVSVDDSSMLL